MKRQSPSPISVCHVLPALPAHGAEQLLLDIAKSMDAEEVRLSVCLISEMGPLVKDFEALGIPVNLIQKKGRFDLSIIWRLARYFRINRYDIIHTHLFTADLWGRLAALFVKTSVVSTSHTTSDPNIGKLGKWLNRCLILRNDAIICVSEAVRTYQIEQAKVTPKKLVVIENGIDLARFDGLPSRESTREKLGISLLHKTLVIVGRLVPLKGHKYLIEAISLLSKSHPFIETVIVGEGECEVDLKKQTFKAGLKDRVHFLGLRRDVPEILKAMDLLAIPSSREGLPIVLLEAMAAGLPVIATRVGGIPEVLKEGESGFFIDQDPQTIANMIKRIFDDPDLGVKLGHKARSITENLYDVKILARRYITLYRSILARR